LIQQIVDFQYLAETLICRVFELLELQPLESTTSLPGTVSAGIVDKNAAHGLGSQNKEMSTVPDAYL